MPRTTTARDDRRYGSDPAIVLVPGVLTAAVKSTHQHLASYGHHMDWTTAASGRQAAGACSACRGRVQITLDREGNVAAVADTAMIAAGSGPVDYAECPSIPPLARFTRRART